MALGRNHKIFNIGNASGTIQGLTRVYHDLTLSGDGTLSSLLGVVGSQADEEVNQFVYDNSATIDEVNTSYQTNSGNFLTAIPDYYATTGDINDLAQSISENYQVKGDYVERNSMASAIESSTSGKLDASSFASVSSDFLVASSLNGYATESFVEETSGAITSLIPTNYYPDTNPSAFVNEDWVTAQGYITGVDLTPYQTTAGMTAYATTGDVANKLDTTSFSNVSSTFLTAHQIIPSAKWENASDVVESNSAQWSENTGDEEVNNAVYNNSAKWNDISVYQSNSSTYLTAHQDLSDYYTKSETSGADELANAFANIPAGDSEVNSYVHDTSATIDEVNSTVQSNSATWGKGGGGGTTYSAGEYIDITDNTISVTGVTDLVAGNAITITTSGTSAIISSNGEAQVQSDWAVTDSNSKAYIRNKPSIPAAQIQSDWKQTNTNAKDYIKNKPSIPSYTGASGINVSNNVVSLDNPVGLVAGDNISITVSGTSAIISAAIQGGNTEVESYVQTNSGVIDDVNTTYQNASAGYLTAHQSLDGYATENWVTAQGYITGVNISESATWNETTEVVQTNSAQWADGGSGDEEVNSFVYNNSATINEVNTAYKTHSASYQPSGNYIPYTGYSASLGYVTNSSFTIHDGSFTTTLGRGTIVIQNRISSNIYNNMAAGPASISFSTPSDSAKVDLPSINKWNDVSTTVQTNSATWGQGASTSGLVSGTNVVKVPFWEGATQGEYWSACISGDVKVATGYYHNETEFDEGPVYSLSAIGADIGNKLNKNTLEDSKTIRTFRTFPDNGSLEVFDIAYKRTNFTNGSAREIDIDEQYDATISFDSWDILEDSKLYSASITAETTATAGIHSNRDAEWKVVDFSNGSAILTATYPVGFQSDYAMLRVNDGWGPITNCEATCTVYTSAELAPIAFKDDIPSGGGGVPQSAFDELKQSYDVLSASYATLSSLFATYSGQWLLPNEGV